MSYITIQVNFVFDLAERLREDVETHEKYRHDHNLKSHESLPIPEDKISIQQDIAKLKRELSKLYAQFDD